MAGEIYFTPSDGELPVVKASSDAQEGSRALAIAIFNTGKLHGPMELERQHAAIRWAYAKAPGAIAIPVKRTEKPRSKAVSEMRKDLTSDERQMVQKLNNLALETGDPDLRTVVLRLSKSVQRGDHRGVSLQ